jgi:hypothetical protein
MSLVSISLTVNSVRNPIADSNILLISVVPSELHEHAEYEVDHHDSSNVRKGDVFGTAPNWASGFQWRISACDVLSGIPTVTSQ